MSKRSLAEISNDEESSEQDYTLSKYMLSMFECANSVKSAQSLESPYKKPSIPSNVIIRTSFKDYQVHDFIVKRSGLFRSMLNSPETWKLEKDDGKFVIDLVLMEKSILDDGTEIEQGDFDIIIRYMYSDVVLDIEQIMFPQLKRIIYMARYFDLNCLNEYLLNTYGNEENIPHTAIWYQINHLMEKEFTEIDFVQMIFNDYCDCNEFSNELVDLVCQQKIIPLEFKLKLLTEQIKKKNGVTTITSEMLKPFEKSIPIIKQQANTIFKNQISYAHNFSEISNLLSIDLTPVEGEPTGSVMISQCIGLVLVAQENRSEKYDLFGDQFNIHTFCSERSSCYWWDLQLNHNSTRVYTSTVYYQQTGKPITKVKRHEFTIYSPQFQQCGERIEVLVLLEC